ncbi:hypothetical protein SLEP1_g28922 [Rubroshorea leprosula]|uniref:Uncharacterized protein n=1 Tax=Rubroshorea leprosula TaxID=152421 RepID=A0AAV5JVA6_9ROSI|nr:hypothetical protein SLEP1_g28922 [Rubroshorea leprosula]
MAGTLLLLFISLSITTNLFNNALAANPEGNLGVSKCPRLECRESEKATFLIVFGDSLFDVGFGIDELCLPSNNKPYGQKLKSQTGRFSDGRTIPDFIAEYVLGAEDRVTPYTCKLNENNDKFPGKSLSFAQAGAGVLESSSKGTGRTLGDQVKLFLELDDKIALFDEASKKKEDTLYLISIGAFDYLQEIRNKDSTSIDPAKVVEKIVEAVTTIMNDKGGRRFAVMSIGPLRHYPIVRQLGLNEKRVGELNRLVDEHNKELKAKLGETLKDSKYSYSILEYHKIIEKMVETPGLYGLNAHTIQSACCGWGPLKAEGCGSLDENGCGQDSIEEYVFFDGMHHTEHINHLLARFFWSNNEFASPKNLKSIAGLEKKEFDLPGF